MLYRLDYLTAVRKGRENVAKAIELMNKLSIISYPLLFIKLGRKDWSPVGEENFYKVFENEGRKAIVVCDSEGNSKIITQWLTDEQLMEAVKKITQQGIQEYKGEIRMPA